MLSFCFGAYALPKYAGRMIDQAHQKLFASKTDNVLGHSLIAWDKICRPKSLGGPDLRLVLIKFTLLNGLGAFSPMIREKYLKGQSFIQYIEKKYDSFIFKSIILKKDIIRGGTR